MAAFAFNHYSDATYMEQYRNYLQNQNFVNQLDNSIRETGVLNATANATVVAIQTREVQNAINVSSAEQREAIIEASNSICSTLESGFTDLNNSLNDISDGINGLSNLIGHGFSVLAESQKITHKYLGQIQNLLRIPDSQKQRVYHIDEGIKYLKNAFRQSPDSDFYTDALEEFKKSESIETKDYFSLYYIGYIHLKSTKHLDPKAAETYFRNSARYYLAEALINGTNVSNNLIQPHNDFILAASEALLHAAEACHIQQKFSEAVELAQEAWKNFPELTKAGLMQAKYLAAHNKPREAAIILEKAIRINRFLILEAFSDKDLNSQPEVLNLFEKLKVEALNEAKSLYSKCSKEIILNSVAVPYLTNIEKLIKCETFLDSKEAVDLLLVSKKWTISSGADISSQGEVVAKISSKEFTGNLFDFLKFERERVLALPKAKDLIRGQELHSEKSKIEGEINNYQKMINEQNKIIYTQWGPWFIGLVGIVITFIFATTVGKNEVSFLNFLNVLATLGTVVGVCVLGLAAIYLIIITFQNWIEISRLKSQIRNRENRVKIINAEINDLDL